MGTQIEASPEEIRKLILEILINKKKAGEQNENIASKLKFLSYSFKDEGYETIHGIIKASQKIIDDVEPDLLRIAERLDEYADKLEEARKNLNF